VSSSRTALVDSRNTRGSGHGPAVSRDDNDSDDGDLVSDGIVTWRRKLPDLSELGRPPSTVDHHQHHQRHASKHLADTRKMSIPTAADWSTGPSAPGRRDRRDAFAQQKSFSYEAGCVGRRLPATPDELARARRDGGARGGGGTAATSTAAYPVDRRRRSGRCGRIHDCCCRCSWRIRRRRRRRCCVRQQTALDSVNIISAR